MYAVSAGADGHRVVFVGPDGKRRTKEFPSETLARAFARKLGAKLGGSPSVEEAVTAYREHLTERGNKERSVGTTIARLERWLGGEGRMIGEFNSSVLEPIYKTRRQKVAFDTICNEVAELRTFFKYAVERGWLKENPASTLRPEGKRRGGKPRLRVDEARRFSSAAALAYRKHQRGWEGGLGCLLAVRCGLRASEVCGLRRRDVDPVAPGVAWVWVASEGEGKTSAATRQVEATGELAELLKAQAEHAKRKGSTWLFPIVGGGHRERTWLRKACHRLCDVAGVPKVSPHGLRGTWATIVRGAGAAARAVADALGHEHERTTERHYLEPGTVDVAAGRAVLRVLEGGAGGLQNGERNGLQSFPRVGSRKGE